MRDQMGWELSFDRPPRRIVSLVPSISELLFDLGLGSSIVGLTKFCVHPSDEVKAKTKIGGTKQIHIERIDGLEPDLIIANKEENKKEDIHELKKNHPVYVSDIKNIQDALSFTNDIGVLCSKKAEASVLISRLEKTIRTVQSFKPREPLRVLYLIWQKPFMAAGSDTYISEILEISGLSNVMSELGEKGMRYPKLELAEIKNLAPDLILLSSEPFPFRETHAQELGEELAIPAKCVDGEFFSWYGSRIIHALPQNLKFLEFLSEFDR